MRKLRFSTRFQKDVKLCQKQGKNMNKLHAVLEILAAGTPLPARYKDHALSGNWKGYRDLHIEPDWLLLYKLEDNTIVLLAATGSHSKVLKVG